MVRRNKATEKSVLDDIMGDPDDDFRDLDEDGGSESDGGRWEDTVRAAMEEEADVERVATQVECMDMQEAGDEASKGAICNARIPAVDLSETEYMQKPVTFQERGSSGQAAHVKWQNNDTQERECFSNGVASLGPLKEGKLHQTRYFIIKSLNHHNIQMSIEKGIWATRAINEPVLEEAFHNSERVVLIFSVNMSGHFHGYAQMMSPIGRRKENVWSESNSGVNPWGRTFKVEWLRLDDLPFQRTLHLKNPLNSYKPVKISRDCQELTQEIGQALCALIDEGADLQGKQKRKSGLRDASLPKRLRGELPVTAVNENCTGRTLDEHVEPMLFSSAQYPTGIFYESCDSQMPIARTCGGTVHDRLSIYTEEHTRLQSRLPLMGERNRSREREMHRERESTMGRKVDKELSGAGKGTSSTVDFAPEDDLLNMTYEEYLQRHVTTKEYIGQHKSSGGFPHSSVSVYGGGWVGNAGIGFSDDEYSNYLINWYSNQHQMMASKGYYAAP